VIVPAFSDSSSVIVPAFSAATQRHPRRLEAERTSQGQGEEGETTPASRRIRDRDHIRYVIKQPCLICGRRPSDPHHLRFAQLRGLGCKASDEFTVPLCRAHHRQVDRASPSQEEEETMKVYTAQEAATETASEKELGFSLTRVARCERRNRSDCHERFVRPFSSITGVLLAPSCEGI
jgi:hypothetical protein